MNSTRPKYSGNYPIKIDQKINEQRLQTNITLRINREHIAIIFNILYHKHSIALPIVIYLPTLFSRQQLRRGRDVAPREASTQLQGIQRLLRQEDRTGVVWKEGNRDCRTGNARNYGAQEQGQGKCHCH